MPYAIEAHFDDATDSLVRDLWARLAGAGVPCRPIQNHHFPHLTFVYGELADAKAFNWDFLAGHTIVPLLFCSLATFANEAGVIFLAPAVSSPLLQRHHLIDSHSGFSQPSELYRPGRWYPHCTLATKLSREQVALGLSLLSDMQLPIEATCVTMNLVEYPDATLISSVDLLAND